MEDQPDVALPRYKPLNLYVVKILRIILVYFALLVASRIQESNYVTDVYGRNKDPPSLDAMVLQVVIAMVVFDIVFIAVLTQVDSRVSVSGLGDLVRYVRSESLAYTLLVCATGFVISRIVTTKRYFNYRENGLRAIRATREIIFSVVFPISAAPMFFKT